MGVFADKVILVTGGSSGLGASTARLLAARGAKVAIAARRREPSEAIVREIETSGGEASFIQADVSRPDDIEAMVKATVSRFGRLDGAVNNAGVTGPVFTLLADVEEADWDATMAVNLKAVWLSMKWEIRAMLETGGGAIVNMSSIFGLQGSNISHSAYAASKHGVIGLTRSAAIDYAKSGIRVNAVCPGYTHSEMVDPYVEAEPELMQKVIATHSSMNRLGDSEEAAEAVAWLLSDAASFVNGAALTVDGGPGPRLW